MNDFIKKLETLKKQICNIDELHKETFLKAVDQSINFTKKLPEYISYPDVTYTIDGGVLFSWDNTKNKLLVAFYGDTEDIGYTYKYNGKFIPGKKDAKINDHIPIDLLDYLLKFNKW